MLHDPRLAPKPPDDGYLRVAVAQLHYSPAAVIAEASYLEQPFALEALWCQVPAKPNFRDIAKRRRTFGARMRELYCKQITAKLSALVEQCAQWHCNLLVLPEYSVPPESIAALLPACGNMVTVLGTHYMEAARTRGTFYSELGIEAAAAGHAIAPVVSGGGIVGSQLKLRRSKWEADIHCSREWNSMPIAALGGRALGVLICIDFLDSKNEVFAQVVQPHLNGTALLAVPSLTPSHTRKEFESDLRKEAKRYGRPVAYANTSTGGGSTVYVEDANSQQVFPHGIAVLDPGEEGVVVVDVDVELNRPRDSSVTRLDHRAVSRPVAAAQLIYLANESGKTHHACIAEIATGTDLNQLVATVQANSARLETSASNVGDRTNWRVMDLLDKADSIDDSERVLCRLRDVFLPADILPPDTLRDLMLDLAEDETAKWTGDHEVAGFIAECRKQLQAARRGQL